MQVNIFFDNIVHETFYPFVVQFLVMLINIQDESDNYFAR